MSNQRRQLRWLHWYELLGNQSIWSSTLLFTSITLSTYSFDQISSCVINIYSFTCLGILSNLFGSFSRSNFNYSVGDWIMLNPLTAEWALRTPIDFTLSNARRFYSSMGNLLAVKGLRNCWAQLQVWARRVFMLTSPKRQIGFPVAL